jgi:hypothetical protein
MPERVVLITAPSVEPVTLADAKLFLKLSTAADDSIVTSLITAARSLCEILARKTFIYTTYDYYLDAFPIGGGYLNRQVRQLGQLGPVPGWLPTSQAPINLPRPPLASVTSVQYFDSTGNLVTLSPSVYDVSLGTQGRIAPHYAQVWPVPQVRIDGVVIRFVAGYGPDASFVPESIKVAIRLAITHFYEHRGDTDVRLPDAVSAILAPEDSGEYA